MGHGILGGLLAARRAFKWMERAQGHYLKWSGIMDDMVTLVFDKILTDDIETMVIAIAYYRQVLASAMPANSDAIKSCDRFMNQVTSNLGRAGRLQIVDRARSRIR